MELAIYIRNLLYNHDIVVIPDFGALQTEYNPAEISSSDKTISPPSNYLIFKNNIKLSDGLLINFVAAQKSIRESRAKEFVATQVELLNQKLDDGETISLEGIGYFSKENGIIRFDRDEETNFLTDSFGLSKIDYKPFELERSMEKENVPLIQVVRKKSYVFVTILACVVIGGLITTYIYYPGISNNVKNIFHKSSVGLPKHIDTLTKNSADSSNSKPGDVEDILDQSTDKKKALAIAIEDEKVSIHGNVSYYIIAGSFRTFQRATSFANQWQKDGYTPEVILFDERVFRVSLGEFSDKTQAFSELKKIRGAKGEDAVWLLSKRM